MPRIEEFLAKDENYSVLSDEEKNQVKSVFLANPDKFQEYIFTGTEVQQYSPEEQQQIADYYLNPNISDVPTNELTTPLKQSNDDAFIFSELKGFGTGALGAVKRAVGGLVTQAGAALDAPDIEAVGQELGKIATEEMNKGREPFDSWVGQQVYDIGTSVVSNAPGILAALSTGTAAPAAVYGGIQAYGTKYADMKDAGYSNEEATGMAVVASAIEMATEGASAVAHLAHGKGTLAKVMWEGAKTEFAEEVAAENLGMLADTIFDVTHEEYQKRGLASPLFLVTDQGTEPTWGDIASRIMKRSLKAGIGGFIGGAVYGSVPRLINRVKGLKPAFTKTGFEYVVPANINEATQKLHEEFFDSVTNEQEYAARVQDWNRVVEMSKSVADEKAQIIEETASPLLQEVDKAFKVAQGEPADNMFIGERALNAPTSQKLKAEKMWAQGVNSEVIRQKTGWFRLPDETWAFEISDKDIAINQDAFTPRKRTKRGGKLRPKTLLGQLLYHPTLYKLYPWLWHVKVSGTTKRGTQATGSTDVETFDIHVEQSLDDIEGKYPAFASTLLHEVQHIIQIYEGWAQGSSLPHVINNHKKEIEAFTNRFVKTAKLPPIVAYQKAVFEVYARHAGEAMSRETQYRQNLTDEERKAQLPFLTEGIDMRAGLFFEKAIPHLPKHLRQAAPPKATRPFKNPVVFKTKGVKPTTMLASGLDRAGNVITHDPKLAPPSLPTNQQAAPAKYQKGAVVAVSPEVPQLKQTRGPKVSVPLDGTVIGVSRVGDEGWVYKIQVHSDTDQELHQGVIEGVKEEHIRAANSAWEFGRRIDGPDNLALYRWVKRIGETIKNLTGKDIFPQILRKISTGILGQFNSRKQRTTSFSWDTADNRALAVRLFTHELGHVIDKLTPEQVKGSKQLQLLKTVNDQLKEIISVEMLEQFVTSEQAAFLKNQVALGDDKEYHNALFRHVIGRTELLPLYRKWNPWNQLTPSEIPPMSELMASTFSILINRPEGIDIPTEAPVFWQLFETLKEKNPSFKKHWTELNQEISQSLHPDGTTQHFKNEQKLADAVVFAQLQEKAANEEGFRASLESLFLSQHSPLYSLVQKDTTFAETGVTKSIRDGLEDVIGRLERTPMEMKRYADMILTRVISEYSKADLRDGEIRSDFRLYLQAKWVITGRYRTAEFIPEITESTLKIIDGLLKDLGLKGKERSKMKKQLLEEWKKETKVTKEFNLWNPGGMTTKDALREIEVLKQKYGDKFQHFEYASKNRAKIRKQYILSKFEIEDAGPETAGRPDPYLSPALLEKMLDSDDWVSFSVLDFMNRKMGGSGVKAIHEQIGTLKNIDDVLSASIYQDYSLIKLANLIDTNRTIIKVLQATEHPEQHIQEAKRLSNGMFRPASREWKLVTVPEWSKNDPTRVVNRGYYVRAPLVQGILHDPGNFKILSRIQKVSGFLGMAPRALYTALSPAFWVLNVGRDYMSFIMNLPGDYQVPIQAIPSMLRGLRDSYKAHIKGEYTPVVNEMIDQGLLLGADSPYAQTISVNPDERVFRAIGRSTELAAATNKQITSFLDAIKIYSRRAASLFTKTAATLEDTTKVAAYRYIKKYHPKMDPLKRNWLIRNVLGSPNFANRGEITPILSNVLLFLNPAIQGTVSGFQLLTPDFITNKIGANTGRFEKSVLLKRLAGWFITHTIQLAALFGLWDSMFGAKDEDIHQLSSEWWRRVGLHDFITKIIVPLGLASNGKAVYLALPQDQVQQVFSGILTTTALAAAEYTGLSNTKVNPVEALGSVARTSAGLVPDLNPWLPIPGVPETLGGDIMAIAQQRNIYDSWRGHNVFSEDVVKAGGEQYYQEALKFVLFERMGLLNPVYRFRSSGRAGIVDEIYEKYLDIPAPVLQPILATFLRVSDQGLRERHNRIIDTYKAIDAKRRLAEHNAQRKILQIAHPENVGMLDQAYRALDSGRTKLTLEEIAAIAKHPAIFFKKMNAAFSGGKWATDLRAIQSASGDTRQALLQDFLNRVNHIR